MKIIKKRKKKTNNALKKRDPEKERTFSALATILASRDYIVRREKLKQGLGWKVISGECQHNDKRLVFVDNKLSQDEQIEFLLSVIVENINNIDNKEIENLPEVVFRRLSKD